MKIVKIGRGSSNNVIVNDGYVSHAHCQIIQENDGSFTLIDVGSKNGTYINGVQRSGQVKLNKNDIVRIGNTTLPWQSYFPPIDTTGSGGDDEGGGSGTSGGDDRPKTSTQGLVLGAIALIVSLIGAGMMLFAFIKISTWGIFGALFGGAKLLWVSVGVNVVAYILASVADEIDDYDTKNIAATIAKWLSGAGLTIMLALYLWLQFS